MPRLFFFKMFAPKARFNSRGVSGSKPLPWHWLWPAREFCSSLSTVTAAAVTKAFAGEDVFFGKHVLFSGEGCQVDFQGRKLRFKAANLSAALRCPQEHNSYLQVLLLNILNLHKIIQNSSKGTRAVGVLNVQWCIAIISSHLPALSICCTFSGWSRKLQGRRQAAFLIMLFQCVSLAENLLKKKKKVTPFWPPKSARFVGFVPKITTCHKNGGFWVHPQCFL